MNKKGQLQLVGLVIGLIAAAIVVGNVLFDQIDNYTAAQTDSDTVTHTQGSNTTVTLEKASDGLTLDSGTLSVPGLTEGTNYTINYSTGVWNINSTTANGTYTGTYDYFEATHIGDSDNRVLMDLVFLFAVIGLAFATGRGFGLI